MYSAHLSQRRNRCGSNGAVLMAGKATQGRQCGLIASLSQRISHNGYLGGIGALQQYQHGR